MDKIRIGNGEIGCAEGSSLSKDVTYLRNIKVTELECDENGKIKKDVLYK